MAFEARRLLQPGPGILLIALILSIMVSISLPAFKAMDITRVHWDQTFSLEGVTLDQLRFGIWDACGELSGKDDFQCPLPDATKGLGYSVTLGKITFGDNEPIATFVTLTGQWTRGLVFHPISTALIFVAFVASIADSIFLTIVASFISFFAALVTFIAFLIDCALYAHVKSELGGSNDGDVITGPGFWLSFVTLILTLIAGCLVFFHHRRQKNGNDGPIFKRFAT